MRSVINISLPKEMVKSIKSEVSSGQFASTSDFFRHLIRLWNTEQLAKDLKRRQSDVKAGKWKVLRSLRDLK